MTKTPDACVAVAHRGRVHVLDASRAPAGTTRHQLVKILWAEIRGDPPEEAFRAAFGVGYADPGVTFF